MLPPHASRHGRGPVRGRRRRRWGGAEQHTRGRLAAGRARGEKQKPRCQIGSGGRRRARRPPIRLTKRPPAAATPTPSPTRRLSPAGRCGCPSGSRRRRSSCSTPATRKRPKATRSMGGNTCPFSHSFFIIVHHMVEVARPKRRPLGPCGTGWTASLWPTAAPQVHRFLQ